MIIRFPDKPMRRTIDSLQQLDDNTRVAEQKLDGWACVIYKDSTRKIAKADWAVGSNKDLFFLSRRGLGGGGPTSLPVMSEIVKDVEAWNLADQSAVVTEWMNRRTTGECPELLYIHDFYWLADKWVGNQILKERRVLLDKLLLSERVKRPECVYQGFVDFFNKQKEIPYTEGCVIKSLNAVVIGDRKESKKNPFFNKIKWRDGADGRTEFKY